MKTRELPGKINPGDELEVQLAPYGDFPNVIGKNGKPEKVTQRFGPDDAEKIVAAFDGELLVDADHASCGGGSTLAYAWVTSLRTDPELGLMGVFRFTDKGAEAVNSREYRFLSVAWYCDKGGHPFELDSVALTNRPNLPVRPILNRKPADVNPPVANGDGTTKEPAMDKIKQMLGLEPDADESAVEAAVQALIDAKAAAEAEKAEAEAEQFAAANEYKCDKETLKNAYLKSPETAKAIVANMKTPAARPHQGPDFSRGRAPVALNAKKPATTPAEIYNAYIGMADGPEKDAYLAANAQAISAGHDIVVNRK